MDAQLKAQLKQVVGVALTASVDFAGQAQFGSAATYWARVETRYRELYRDGVVEKTTHMVILSEDLALTEQSVSTASLGGLMGPFPGGGAVLDHVDYVTLHANGVESSPALIEFVLFAASVTPGRTAFTYSTSWSTATMALQFAELVGGTISDGGLGGEKEYWSFTYLSANDNATENVSYAPFAVTLPIASRPTDYRDMHLWLPGFSLATASVARRALQVERCIDENGALDHWEVMV